MQPLPREKQHKIPGVIATMTSGFDLVTRHLWLIILPLIIDVFFWLGPRLSIEDLALRSAEILRLEESFVGYSDQLVQLSSQLNLFTALSIPLIGVPALMSGPTPAETPVTSTIYQVGGSFEWVVIYFALSLTGLLIAVIYMSLIAKTIRAEGSASWREIWHILQRIFKSTYRLVGLGFLFILALVIVLLPLTPVALLLSLISINFFVIIMLIGFAIVALYFCLAVPSIIFGSRPLKSAIVESIKITHKNLLPTINMVVSLILIGNGINLLWHMADDGSWLTLVSIIGHAFIGTALLTSFFLYYRNQSRVHLTKGK